MCNIYKKMQLLVSIGIVFILSSSFSGCFESSAKVDFGFAPSSPTVNSDIQFVSSSGSFVKFLWDFGDGNTSIESNPIHNYSGNGTYVVRLTVWDSDGNSHSIAKNVIVSGVPGSPPELPVIEASYVSDLQPWVQYVFSAKSTDVDGDKISYCFDWGDGSSSCSNQYIKSDIYYSERHSWEKPGAYVVKVKAVDVRGAESAWNSTNVTVAAPAPVPDFNVTTVSGSDFRLSDCRGNVVVLDFMATTCPACREQLSVLNSVYENLSGNVSFLTVFMRYFNPRLETIENVTSLKVETGTPWSFALTTSDNDIASNFIIERDLGFSVPSLFIIDKDGYITFSHIGVIPESDLLEEINKDLS